MPMIGEKAPDFILEDHSGQKHQLRQYLEKGPVLLAFYPGDFKPICTRQLCAYQDSVERFQKHGVTLLGISPNTPDQHREFKEKYGITFPLLADHKREVTKRYEITSLFLLGGSSRAVFIIGKNGIVHFRYVEPTTITHRKVDELMTALDRLKAAGQLG